LNKRNTTIVALCQVISITVARQQFLECIRDARRSQRQTSNLPADRSKGQFKGSIEQRPEGFSVDVIDNLRERCGSVISATSVECG